MSKGSDIHLNRPSWKGTALVGHGRTTPLTDADPQFKEIVSISHYNDLVVDVKIDKGATVDILPILSREDNETTSRPGTQFVISDGGTADGEGCIYSLIHAMKALVTVTKTEAGDSTITEITITGSSL